MKMDEIITSKEEFPSSLIEFSKAWNKKNPNKSDAMNHNLYLLQTVDRDGNITGEAYGMNLMTTNGFNKLYTANGGSISDLYLYIGSSDTTPTLADTSITTPITTTGSTHYSIGKDYYYSELLYGTRYDAETNIVSAQKREYRGYFDYNISGISTDTEIKEIGYGKAYNNLYTHALIYDAEGNPSSIVKRINERLIITMFWSICFKPDWITEAYNNGVYMAFSPHWFLLRNALGHYDAIGAFYMDGNDNVISSKSYFNAFYSDNTTINGDVMTSSATLGNCYIESARSYISKILVGPTTNTWDGNSPTTYYTGGYNSLYFLLFTHDKLPSPEEIVCERVWTNASSSVMLTNAFGASNSNTTYSANGIIPATDFDIQSLSMYNHLTHEWDIEEQFKNNPNYEYLLKMEYNAWVYMYLPFLNKSQTVRVYINPRTDIPINSFSTSGITLYATDEYWNPDSYVLIADTKNVDEALQTKRYYVRLDAPSGDTRYISPVRTTVDRHQIICPSSITLQTNESFTNWTRGGELYQQKPISSDVYNYIATAVHIVYPDVNGETKVYNLRAPSNRYAEERTRFSTKTGDRLITLGYDCSWYNASFYPSNARVYDMTGDGTSAPTYVDYTIEWSSGDVGYPYYSETDEGFIVMQRLSNVNEAIIMDIYGEDGTTPIFTKLENVRNCIALNRTTNCVYMTDDSTTLSFEIYDMSTNTVVDSFSLPANGYSFAGIAGWRDFIYVRVNLSGSYSTYFYNMNTKQLVYLSDVNIDGMAISEWSKYKIASCDECMVVQCSNDFIKIFKASDPTTPINTFNSNYSSTDVGGSSYLASVQLKYMNEGKQLLMTLVGRRAVVVDIGWVLDNGPTQFLPIYNFSYNDYARGIMGFYKEYVYYISSSGSNIEMYPYQNYVAHKMVGTTYTIQSYNNPKRIGGRKYSFSVTNDTSKWNLSSE